MPSRLIDKLKLNRILPEIWRNGLSLHTVIVADNVADYIMHDILKHTNLHEALEELIGVRITPPLELTFVQFMHPVPASTLEWGIEVIREDIKDDPNRRWAVYFGLYCSEWRDIPHFADAVVYLDHDGFITLPIDPHFELTISPFYERAFDANTAEYQRNLTSTFITTVITAMWTFGFMNIKNVKQEAVEPSRGDSKRHEKHYGLPLTRYHVLRINALGSRAPAGEPQSGTHAPQGLHIRRGHFRTYTEAAPLFGKHVGTYWIDQYTAGKKSDRKIDKDYEVTRNGD